MDAVKPLRGTTYNFHTRLSETNSSAADLRAKSKSNDTQATVVTLTSTQNLSQDENIVSTPTLSVLSPEVIDLDQKVSDVLSGLGFEIAESYKQLLASAVHHRKNISNFVEAVSKSIQHRRHDSQISAYQKSANSTPTSTHDILA